MDPVKKLNSAFASLSKAYARRKRAAEGAVRDWRWATSTSFDLRPLHLEQNGLTPGRALRKPPARPDGCVCYGFDARGRIVVVRRFNAVGHYETFLDWEGDSVEAAHFDYERKRAPINLLVAWLDEKGRTTRSAVAAVRGYTAEEYRWGRHGVTEIEVTRADRKAGRVSAIRMSHRVRASYAGDGTLKKVERVWPPAGGGSGERVEVMFERRGKMIFRASP